jgi:hypothetical protein
MNRKLLNDIRREMSKRRLLYVTRMWDKKLIPKNSIKYPIKKWNFNTKSKIFLKTENKII